MVRNITKQEVKCLLHGQCHQVQPTVPEFLFPARPQFPVIQQTLKPCIHLRMKWVLMTVLIAELSMSFSRAPH